MHQTKQQEAGDDSGMPGARKHWELFWRILAGLMLIVIAWVAWVMYQITPRSVVTPLAYESGTKPVGTPPAPAGVTLPPAPSAAQAAAVMAMDQAQAALRAGAHQSSADVQVAAMERGAQEVRAEDPPKREGLKLSTEISAPPAAEKKIPEKREGKPGGG